MAKNSKVKVSKIDIEIGDIEVSITPEQAKQLLEALSELVGEKKVVERVIERDRFRHWWEYPYWSSGIISTGDKTVGGTTAVTFTADNTAKISV